MNYVCSAIFAFTKLGSLKHNMSTHDVLYEHEFFISLTSYYRENLKKKIMHSTTFNPAGLEAMYAAESMLPRVCCLNPHLTLYCIEMEIFF